MSQNQPDVNTCLLWGNPVPKQTYQEFVAEGVARFVKKFGYPPNLIESSTEDEDIDIPDVKCVKLISVSKSTIRIYPATDNRS
jgi:hypothetical protein